MKQLYLIASIFHVLVNASESDKKNHFTPEIIQDCYFALSLLQAKSPEISCLSKGTCLCAATTCTLYSTNPYCWFPAAIVGGICLVETGHALKEVIATQPKKDL